MPGNKHWSEEEKGHIRSHYQGISNRDLRILLPTRTEQAIREQAMRMGERKCHDRLREMGRENVQRRYAMNPTPPDIEA